MSDLPPQPVKFHGNLERVDGREVIGWALDPAAPSKPLRLQIRVGEKTIGIAVTGIPRADVEKVYGVTGNFGFLYYAETPIPNEHIDQVRVYQPDRDRYLPDATAVRIKTGNGSHVGRDMRVHVENFEQMIGLAPQGYEWVRLDPILNCNVKCVYCHNYRTKKKFELEVMEQFIREKITSVVNFQVGCSMEPTLDTRLCDVFEMIARTPARPLKSFKLCTNGTLLHRHDGRRLVEAGLNGITVSVDSWDDSTLPVLRGGTQPQRVKENICTFMREFPSVKMTITAVVTKKNVKRLNEFVAASLKLGVRNFIFHEVFFFPDSDIVQAEEMNALLLDDGEFFEAQNEVMKKFSNDGTFHFAHDVNMKRVHKECGLEESRIPVNRSQA